jgi:hypothetical protein
MQGNTGLSALQAAGAAGTLLAQADGDGDLKCFHSLAAVTHCSLPLF